MKENEIFKVESNTCIDWFKFKVLYNFSLTENTQERKFILQLFDILKIDESSLTFLGGTKDYKARYIADCDVDILSEPTKVTKRGDDRNYFIVDMSGSSCRNFEKRGGSWLELFKFYLDNFSVFEGHRIDTALDDFQYLTMSSILRLVKSGAYSGKFKGCYKPTEEIEDYLKAVVSGEESFDRKIIEKLKKDKTLKGLSITWGNKQANSIQFQIYDKLLERIARGKEVEVDKWIRFEMRFMKAHTDDVVQKLYKGMVKDGGISKTVKGIIADRFQLRSRPCQKNPDRIPLYKPWKDFLGSVDNIPIDRASQYDVENGVTRARRYIDRSLSGTLLKVFLSDPDSFFSYIAENIVDAAKRDEIFNEALVATVNYYRIDHYLKKQNLKEMRNEVEKLADRYGISLDEEEEDNSDLPF